MRNPVPLAMDTLVGFGRVAKALTTTRLSRRALLTDSARIRMNVVRSRMGASLPNAVVQGHSIKVGDYESFAFLFDEIFVRDEYRICLPSEPSIIDCGANIGLASLRFTLSHPGACIRAIEADPVAAALLGSNVEANGWPVSIHAVAVGAREGEGLFYRSPFIDAGVCSGLEKRQGLDSSVIVKIVTLSSLIGAEHIDLLKLDIEGGEGDVLQELTNSGAIECVDRMLVDAAQSNPLLLASLLEASAFNCEMRGSLLIATRTRVR